MTTIFTNNELVAITPNDAIAALKRQLSEIGRPGDVDSFGETRTLEDVRSALSAVASAARIYADKLV